jgi:hypothetical protein
MGGGTGGMGGGTGGSIGGGIGGSTGGGIGGIGGTGGGMGGGMVFVAYAPLCRLNCFTGAQVIGILFFKNIDNLFGCKNRIQYFLISRHFSDNQPIGPIKRFVCNVTLNHGFQPGRFTVYPFKSVNPPLTGIMVL